MERYFNIEGVCKPKEHYMVNLESRMEEVKRLVEKKKYFSINRARQFGKTTLLKGLKNYLSGEYIVISLDFQLISYEDFQKEAFFVSAFANEMVKALKNISGIEKVFSDRLTAFASGVNKEQRLGKLFECLSELCETAPKPVVMMIDEVDSAANNQVFLDFLAQLRGYYLQRDERPIFQSVILAGVYDVRNLKRKIRSEEERKVNSPWNISARFDVELCFSKEDIAGMLCEYEQDHHTGMAVETISEMIYNYTSGYPFLVSRVCKYMDEEVVEVPETCRRSDVWTKDGFLIAIKLLLEEKNALFESLVNKLADYTGLRKVIHAILFDGAKIPYNQLNAEIEIAAMFGFIKNENGNVAVANRIFEILLYNLFLSEEMVESLIFRAGSLDRNQFIQNGILNMDMVMERFMVHFHDLYGNSDIKFMEENGRRFFLLFLKPIINGVGNYYVEAQTRDLRRTDIIVDYNGKQYIIEIKIWHGEEYNRRGEKQLMDYLDAYHAKKGYLLSFNFNKKKKTGIKKIQYGDKEIFEVVI